MENTTRGTSSPADRVAAMAHQALDTAAEKGEDLTSAQRKLIAQTCEYVAANPMKSVGIALVAGFLLSKIIL